MQVYRLTLEVCNMASAQPRRLDIIGRVAGREYDSGIIFEEALNMTQGHTLSKPLSIPIVKNLQRGETALADLPFDSEPVNKLHQFVDMVYPYEETHDLKELEKLFQLLYYLTLI